MGYDRRSGIYAKDVVIEEVIRVANTSSQFHIKKQRLGSSRLEKTPSTSCFRIYLALLDLTSYY